MPFLHHRSPRNQSSLELLLDPCQERKALWATMKAGRKCYQMSRTQAATVAFGLAHQPDISDTIFYVVESKTLVGRKNTHHDSAEYNEENYWRSPICQMKRIRSDACGQRCGWYKRYASGCRNRQSLDPSQKRMGLPGVPLVIAPVRKVARRMADLT